MVNWNQANTSVANPRIMECIKPVGDGVLVEVQEDDKIKDGIHIPDCGMFRAHKGIVRIVGTGLYDEARKVIPSEVEVGDSVIFPIERGTDVQIQGKCYRLIPETEILCKMEHE